MQEIFLQAEELVAFQEGLCYMYFGSSYSCDCIALPIPALQTKALHSSTVLVTTAIQNYGESPFQRACKDIKENCLCSQYFLQLYLHLVT